MSCISLLVVFACLFAPSWSLHSNEQQKFVNAVCSKPLASATTLKGFCAFSYVTGLGAPRGITVASNNDILVVDQKSAHVLVLWEENGNINKNVLASAEGINHAVIIHEGFLYASSPTTVYRWAYTPGTRKDLGSGQIVIKNVPCCHHVSRALAFGPTDKLLYVQSGSGSNVDPDSTHARIKRFDISKAAGPIDWSTGELFADGTRNEAGIRFDANGVLWGVENGVDDLNRPDLGGDIHNTNPSEEMNMFKQPGAFYGYPYCWSEGQLAQNKSHPTGTQWAHPNFMKDGKHTDAWCQDPANVKLPVYNFPAHTAPLDILFYNGTTFPDMKNDAFVAQHGSWDRAPAVGYAVRHVKFTNGMPVSDELFLGYSGPGAVGPNWPHRPVGLAVGKCGGVECLLVTSDASGSILAVVASA